jgi:hypothetical protein
MRPGVLRVDKSLLAASAFLFQICCAMGSRKSPLSRAGPEVALNAPEIILAALACRLLRVFIVFFVYPSPVSFAMGHAEHPYSICGTMVAW